MHRHPASSSSIRAIGYDVQTQTLEVEFLTGWVYQYYGVPEHICRHMMQASSKGNFLYYQIQNRFPYSRVG